ncbi:MAG: polymer-forming cytoskeletal protein [Patescibacteria group bacterium]
MFKPKPEKQNMTQEGETIVGESVKLEGNIDSQESVSIFGRVIGKIKTVENVKIGEQAEIKGDVEAENVFVAGKVEGNIIAKEKLEIASSGKIFGDLQTKSLTIAQGAFFCGQCQMENKSQISNLKNKEA